MPLQPQDTQGPTYVQAVPDQSLGNLFGGIANTIDSFTSKSGPTESSINRDEMRLLARNLKRADGKQDLIASALMDFAGRGNKIDAGVKSVVEQVTGISYDIAGKTSQDLAIAAEQESVANAMALPEWPAYYLSTRVDNPDATPEKRVQLTMAIIAKEKSHEVNLKAANTWSPLVTKQYQDSISTTFDVLVGALQDKQDKNIQIRSDDTNHFGQQWSRVKLGMMSTEVWANATTEEKKGVMEQIRAVDEMLSGFKAATTQEAIDAVLLERMVEVTRLSFMEGDNRIDATESVHLRLMSDSRNALGDPETHAKLLAVLVSNLKDIQTRNGGEEKVLSLDAEASLVRLELGTSTRSTKTVVKKEKAKLNPQGNWRRLAGDAIFFSGMDAESLKDPKNIDAAVIMATNIGQGLENSDGFVSWGAIQKTFGPKFVSNMQIVYKNEGPEVAAALYESYRAGLGELSVNIEKNAESYAKNSIVRVDRNGDYSINTEWLANYAEENRRSVTPDAGGASTGGVIISYFDMVLSDVYKGNVKDFVNGSMNDLSSAWLARVASGTTTSASMAAKAPEIRKVIQDLRQSMMGNVDKQLDAVKALNHLEMIGKGLKPKDSVDAGKIAKDAVEATKGAITQTVIPDVGTGPAEIFSYVTRGTLKPVLNEGEGKVSSMTKPEAYSNMKTVLEGPFRRAAGLFGGPLTVNDGIAKEGTSREKNRKGSQHFEGTALDISIAGMSDDDKLRLVDSLEKAGFQGLGFGKTIIHADMGKRRSWHYFGEGNDSAVFAGGKTVGELINTHNGLTIPREGSYKTSEGNSGSAIEPDNDSDHGEGEPSGFAMGSTAPMSSTRPQGRPESDPALSGVIPEEASQPPIKLSKAIKDGTQTVSDEILKLVERLALDPDKILMFASKADVDKALTEGIVKVGDTVIVDGGTRMKIGTVAAR